MPATKTPECLGPAEERVYCVSVSDAAGLLARSEYWIRDLMARGTLPARSKGGRLYTSTFAVDAYAATSRARRGAPGPAARDLVIRVRVNPKEHSFITTAAAARRLTISEYVRQATCADAAVVLNDSRAHPGYEPISNKPNKEPAKDAPTKMNWLRSPDGRPYQPGQFGTTAGAQGFMRTKDCRTRQEQDKWLQQTERTELPPFQEGHDMYGKLVWEDEDFERAKIDRRAWEAGVAPGRQLPKYDPGVK